LAAMQLNGFCSCPRIKSLHAHIPLDFAFRVIVLADGKLVESGTIQDVLTMSRHPVTQALVKFSYYE